MTTTRTAPWVATTVEYDEDTNTTTFEAWERIDHPTRVPGRHCHTMYLNDTAYGRMGTQTGMTADERRIEHLSAVLAILTAHRNAISGLDYDADRGIVTVIGDARYADEDEEV